MSKSNFELSRSNWLTAISRTGVIMALAVIGSVLAAWFVLDTFSDGLNAAGLATSILTPLLIGSPVTLYLMVKHEQLKLANHKLQVLASTDWLTACLNRGAFTHQVSTHLASDAVRRGAFLVVDVDHFKTINDAFGHDRGDEALQMITEIIKESVREDDLVGRIGGEEFGIFLRDASVETAEHVAERIRKAINAIPFTPAGDDHALSVSVGGAVFDTGIGFAELFRFADQRLYGVKQSGRNRVEVAAVAAPLAAPAA